MLIKILEALKEVRRALSELDLAIQQRKVVLALHRRTQTLHLISTLPGNYTSDNEPQIYTKIKQEFDRLTRELIQLLESSFWAGFNVDLENRTLRLHTPLLPVPTTESSLLDEITAPMSAAMSLALQHNIGIMEPKLSSIAASLTSFIDLLIIEPSASTQLPSMKVEKRGNDTLLTLRSNETSKSSPVVSGLSNATTFFEFLNEHFINPIIAESTRLEAIIGKTTDTNIPPIERVCSHLGSILLPYMVDRLVRCCFESSIPAHRSELEAYQRTVSVEVDRFVPVLSKFDWLHSDHESANISITDTNNDLTIQSPSPSNGWASISKFVDFLKNSQLHFAIKKRHASLARARELLLSGVYTSRLVGDIEFDTSPSSPDALMSAPLFKFPRCKVRDVVIELVELAENLVSDAFNEPVEESNALSVPSTPSSRYNRAHIQRILLETAKDVFDLYRAMIPSFERHRISNIPSLSMLFHNDCQYMAHHATLIGAQCRLHLRFDETNETDSQNAVPQSVTPPPSHGSSLSPSRTSQTILRSASESVLPESSPLPLFSLAELVPTFRSMAEQFYLDIISGVRDQLLQILEHMDNLRNSDNPARKQKCLLSARHIVSELESRDLMWSETLPVELHRVTIGRLLNEVVEWMISAAMQIPDFMEAETEALHAIFTTLFPLAKMFVNIHESASFSPPSDQANGKGEIDSVTLTRQSCAKYVKSWLKFEDLTDAFTMRMVELVDRYNRGIFHFSRPQTISLIKALFLETPKRHECIESLRTDLPWTR